MRLVFVQEFCPVKAYSPKNKHHALKSKHTEPQILLQLPTLWQLQSLDFPYREFELLDIVGENPCPTFRKLELVAMAAQASCKAVNRQTPYARSAL